MKLRNISKIHCESLTKFYGTRKHWNSYAKLGDINALISDKFKVCVIDHKTKKETANAEKFQKEFHLHAAGNVPLTWGRKIYICQGLWALITAREQDIAHVSRTSRLVSSCRVMGAAGMCSLKLISKMKANLKQCRVNSSKQESPKNERLPFNCAWVIFWEPINYFNA